METVYFIPLYFLCGVIIGIIITFSCIRVAMLLPMLNPQPYQNKPQKQKEQIKKPRWDPRSLVPPSATPRSSITEPLDYESVVDLLDPVDPSKR